MLPVLLLSSLASDPLHYICWNSTWELLSDASIAASGSNQWLKPTGAIVLWLHSPSHCQGPPRDSSLAWEIEISSWQLIMLDSLEIFVMTFPTVYPLVYFEAWQYTLEISAKWMLKSMASFHIGIVNTGIYFRVLGFGLRFLFSALLVYGVPAQKCLLFRKVGCEVL